LLQANYKTGQGSEVDSRYFGNNGAANMVSQVWLFGMLSISSLKMLEGSQKQGVSGFLHLSYLSFFFLLGKKNDRFLILFNKEFQDRHIKEF
jgi:hypothetical protein